MWFVFFSLLAFADAASLGRRPVDIPVEIVYDYPGKSLQAREEIESEIRELPVPSVRNHDEKLQLSPEELVESEILNIPENVARLQENAEKKFEEKVQKEVEIMVAQEAKETEKIQEKIQAEIRKEQQVEEKVQEKIEQLLKEETQVNEKIEHDTVEKLEQEKEQILKETSSEESNESKEESKEDIPQHDDTSKEETSSEEKPSSEISSEEIKKEEAVNDVVNEVVQDIVEKVVKDVVEQKSGGINLEEPVQEKVQSVPVEKETVSVEQVIQNDPVSPEKVVVEQSVVVDKVEPEVKFEEIVKPEIASDSQVLETVPEVVPVQDPVVLVSVPETVVSEVQQEPIVPVVPLEQVSQPIVHSIPVVPNVVQHVVEAQPVVHDTIVPVVPALKTSESVEHVEKHVEQHVEQHVEHVVHDQTPVEPVITPVEHNPVPQIVEPVEQVVVADEKVVENVVKPVEVFEKLVPEVPQEVKTVEIPLEDPQVIERVDIVQEVKVKEPAVDVKVQDDVPVVEKEVQSDAPEAKPEDGKEKEVEIKSRQIEDDVSTTPSTTQKPTTQSGPLAGLINTLGQNVQNILRPQANRTGEREPDSPNQGGPNWISTFQTNINGQLQSFNSTFNQFVENLRPQQPAQGQNQQPAEGSQSDEEPTQPAQPAQPNNPFLDNVQSVFNNGFTSFQTNVNSVLSNANSFFSANQQQQGASAETQSDDAGSTEQQGTNPQNAIQSGFQNAANAFNQAVSNIVSTFQGGANQQSQNQNTQNEEQPSNQPANPNIPQQILGFFQNGLNNIAQAFNQTSTQSQSQSDQPAQQGNPLQSFISGVGQQISSFVGGANQQNQQQNKPQTQTNPVQTVVNNLQNIPQTNPQEVLQQAQEGAQNLVGQDSPINTIPSALQNQQNQIQEQISNVVKPN